MKSTLPFIKGILILLMPLSLHASAPPSARPNIILCMTDDQGWGDTGYNGHPHLRTPHLDRMSEEGVTFTRFYSAAAMCSPTRGSVYTGRNPYRFGITYAMEGKLEDKEIPITTVLKEQGYTTGHFGKWHMGSLSKIKGDQNRWGKYKKDPARYFCPPWERDVDVSFVTESKVPTWDPLVDWGKPDAPLTESQPFGNDYFTGPGQIAKENLEGDDSRVIMDRVIPFIEKAVEGEKPFFAAVWFHTPHSPVVGGPEYLKMYSEHPVDYQHYYACLTAMDEQMGRLRAELKRLGADKNTMLWFCSDNGPARQGSSRQVGSNGGLSGYKLSTKEGGIRVPGLLVWPEKFKEPQTIDAPCVTSDYFPTILDALGIELPKDRKYDGISLLPLLEGKRQERGHAIGFLNKEGKDAVWMEDQYKLSINLNQPINKQIKLTDINADPGEKKDLSKELPEVKARMEAELMQWKEDVLKELAEVNQVNSKAEQ